MTPINIDHFIPSVFPPIAAPGSHLDIMNVDAACGFLGLAPDLLEAAAKNNEIPCRKVGKTFLFSKRRLNEWIYNSPCICKAIQIEDKTIEP